MMYDFARNYVPNVDTAKAWLDPKKYTSKKIAQRWTPAEAYEMCKQSLDPDQYVDSHCLVFTPASFIEVLREIITQGLLDFEVSYFLETQEYELEFYVSLRKLKSGPKRQQQQLDSLPGLSKPVNPEKELNHQITMLQQEVHLLKRSFSWRVTKPIRKIKSAAKKLR
jgi:hypothetical protein